MRVTVVSLDLLGLFLVVFLGAEYCFVARVLGAICRGFFTICAFLMFLCSLECFTKYAQFYSSAHYLFLLVLGKAFDNLERVLVP